LKFSLVEEGKAAERNVSLNSGVTSQNSCTIAGSEKE
jgi:hypothetical protein